MSPTLRNHLLQEFSRFETGCSELSNILHSGSVWWDDSMYQMSTGGCKFFMTVDGVTVLRITGFWKMPLVEWSVRGGSHERHYCHAPVVLVIWRDTGWYTHSVPALFMTYYLYKSSLWGVQPGAYRAVLSGDDAPSWSAVSTRVRAWRGGQVVRKYTHILPTYQHHHHTLVLIQYYYYYYYCITVMMIWFDDEWHINNA